MNRRDFLKTTALATAAVACAVPAVAAAKPEKIHVEEIMVSSWDHDSSLQPSRLTLCRFIKIGVASEVLDFVLEHYSDGKRMEVTLKKGMIQWEGSITREQLVRLLSKARAVKISAIGSYEWREHPLIQTV